MNYWKNFIQFWVYFNIFIMSLEDIREVGRKELLS